MAVVVGEAMKTTNDDWVRSWMHSHRRGVCTRLEEASSCSRAEQVLRV